jgi:hypothetical protein
MTDRPFVKVVVIKTAPSSTTPSHGFFASHVRDRLHPRVENWKAGCGLHRTTDWALNGGHARARAGLPRDHVGPDTNEPTKKDPAIDRGLPSLCDGAALPGRPFFVTFLSDPS